MSVHGVSEGISSHLFESCLELWFDKLSQKRVTISPLPDSWEFHRALATIGPTITLAVSSDTLFHFLAIKLSDCPLLE